MDIKISERAEAELRRQAERLGKSPEDYAREILELELVGGEVPPDKRMTGRELMAWAEANGVFDPNFGEDTEPTMTPTRRANTEE